VGLAGAVRLYLPAALCQPRLPAPPGGARLARQPTGAPTGPAPLRAGAGAQCEGEDWVKVSQLANIDIATLHLYERHMEQLPPPRWVHLAGGSLVPSSVVAR
jgi:hypothetical protein